jgi:MarR family transcriptional regulator, organic hydroperoxide resistance regulator
MSSTDTRVREGQREAALEELRRSLMGMFRAQRKLRGRDARIEGGLSFAHYPLLSALAREGELSAGQLAADAALTPATVTQMLDALVAIGLVERSRSETDRRVVTTRLTDEGRRRVERKEAELIAKWREALSEFEAQDLAAATRVLARLASYLDDL